MGLKDAQTLSYWNFWTPLIFEADGSNRGSIYGLFVDRFKNYAFKAPNKEKIDNLSCRRFLNPAQGCNGRSMRNECRRSNHCRWNSRWPKNSAHRMIVQNSAVNWQEKDFYQQGNTGVCYSTEKPRPGKWFTRERNPDALVWIEKAPLETYASESNRSTWNYSDEKNAAEPSLPKIREDTALFSAGKKLYKRIPHGCCLIISWISGSTDTGPSDGSVAAGNCSFSKFRVYPEYRSSSGICRQRCIEPDFVTCSMAVSRSVRHLTACHLISFFHWEHIVGREIQKKAAENWSNSPELGGKSPCIVCADADIPHAARRIAWGKFMNAGQTCVAPDYVLVDHRVSQTLTQELIKAIRSSYGSDVQKSPDYGRIVNRRHFERLCCYLEQGIIYRRKTGFGRLLLNRHPVTCSRGCCVHGRRDFRSSSAPLEFVIWKTALNDCQEDSSSGTLSVYFWFICSKKIEEQTLSGGVCMNDVLCQIHNPGLPFVGIRESGIGRYHGKESFYCFSQIRSIMKRRTWPEIRWVYPPYRISVDRFRKFSSLIRSFLFSSHPSSGD